MIAVEIVIALVNFLALEFFKWGSQFHLHFLKYLFDAAVTCSLGHSSAARSRLGERAFWLSVHLLTSLLYRTRGVYVLTMTKSSYLEVRSLTHSVEHQRTEMKVAGSSLQSTRRPRNLFHPRNRVTSSNFVWISNELNARPTFKHYLPVSQLYWKDTRACWEICLVHVHSAAISAGRFVWW